MAQRRDKGAERRIAAARIDRLLAAARDEALGPDADLADRYAVLARRIAMRYQLPLRRDQKAQVCRACSAYQVPGVTSRTRFRRGRLVRTCLRCGRVRRRILEHP